jgi:hypothetical protein
MPIETRVTGALVIIVYFHLLTHRMSWHVKALLFVLMVTVKSDVVLILSTPKIFRHFNPPQTAIHKRNQSSLLLCDSHEVGSLLDFCQTLSLSLRRRRVSKVVI